MSAGRLLPRRKLPRLSAGLGQIPKKDGNTMSKLVSYAAKSATEKISRRNLKHYDREQKRLMVERVFFSSRTRK